MDKKFYYSELEATIQKSPKIAFRVSCPSEREVDPKDDEAASRQVAQARRVMEKLAKDFRKPAQCQHPVHHQPQGEKDISDTSDLESVQGIGFVDLYRRNVPYERVVPGPNALELHSLNRVPKMSKESRFRIIREFRVNQEKEVAKSSTAGSPSPKEPSSPRAESPTPTNPKFRFRNQNSPCKCHCHGARENEPRVGQRIRKVPSYEQSERVPERESYAVKSSILRETPSSESSDECSEKSTETEFKNQVGLRTKSLGQAEPSQAPASYSFSKKLERIEKSPSPGEQIVFGSRELKKRNYEMDTRIRGGPVEEPACRQCMMDTRIRGGSACRQCMMDSRIRGGSVEEPACRQCMMMNQFEEARQQEPCSSRMNSRPRSVSSSLETRYGREQARAPSVVTLLSPRVLEFSQSSDMEIRHECACEQCTDPERSCPQRTEDAPRGRRSSRSASMRSVSESHLVFCCSRGIRLPSLRTSDTFTEIWKKESPRDGYQNQSLSRFAGGLYGQVDRLRFQPIDRLDAGFSGSPIFEGAGKEEARERVHYFATEFDRLPEAERRKDIELRIGQLRILQATSDQAFRQHYEEQRPGIRPVLTNGINFCCPLGYRQCPPVRNETLLSHTLRYHLNEHGLELREVFASDRLLLIFNPRSYDLGVNACMSAIMYAGVRHEPSTLPGRRFLPVPNSNLPPCFGRFSGHLPLFVMICRNRRGAIDGRRVRFDGSDQDQDDRDQDEQDREVDLEDVLALWVLSVDLPVPVHAIVTVFNRRMDVTRSSVMQVRSLHQSQNCQKFMRSSRQYMRLSEQDLCILTSDNTEPLYLEVSVKEYAGTLPRHFH